MIGHFGPSIIGEEAAAQERKDAIKEIFGPAVLATEPLEVPTDGGRDGASLRANGAGLDPEPRSRPPEPAPHVTDYMIGVRGLRAALAENPLLVDEFMHAELARPDGFRVTAVRELLAAENRRPSGARPEVTATLEEWERQAMPTGDGDGDGVPGD